ncbi:MAG: NADP-dependent oxidoreductase [Firmicutes bacterium]|nr:NADP-dependent oxidoreductase [Bacillota bacterium]
MEAMVITEYGGADVLHWQDVSHDAVGPHDVVIRIYATSVNPVDWKVRKGYLKGRLPLEFPAILGWDAAGIVESVGSNVTGFRRGDPVFSRPATNRPGTYAELVVVDEKLVAPKPPRLTYLEAASIPLAGLTAWEGLVEIADLQPGQQVLIHGGAGGVGSYAVQLAKARGAVVAATGSAGNLEYLRALGADRAIDYQEAPFEEAVESVDVVFDTIGGETQSRSYAVLKRGGILVSIAQPPNQEEAQRLGVKGTWFFLEPDGEKLRRLGELFARGAMTPQVHHEFALNDLPAAHQLSETGHARGKIGIVVDQGHAYDR